MMWFFDEPSNDPYVSINFDVAAAPALTFLDAHAREHGERASLQHLVSRAIALALAQTPALNVKVLGRAIYQLDSVSLAMPVHLGGDTEGMRAGKDETGMIVVPDVDRKSLLDVARETRAISETERRGETVFNGSALARKFMRAVPAGVLHTSLDLARTVTRQPVVHSILRSQLAVSSAVTNVGSIVKLPPGARFRGASTTIPSKVTPVASVFGVGPVQDAALVQDGAVVAGRVLPIIMMVDHRAIDGVLMGTAATRVARMLTEPAQLA